MQISFSDVVYSFGNVNIISNRAEIVVSFIVTANAFLYDLNHIRKEREIYKMNSPRITNGNE